jgi:hypothetical protein
MLDRPLVLACVLTALALAGVILYMAWTVGQ